MTHRSKTVIEIAREAWRDHPMYGGVDIPDPADYDLAALERFAALIREDERNQQNPVAWIEVERGIPMFAKFEKNFKPKADGLFPLYM